MPPVAGATPSPRVAGAGAGGGGPALRVGYLADDKKLGAVKEQLGVQLQAI